MPDPPSPKFLHIYVVKRTDIADIRPGELNGYVVCAESERHALELAPAGGFGRSVTLVIHKGIAINGASPGVIWPRPKVGAPPPPVVSDPDAGDSRAYRG